MGGASTFIPAWMIQASHGRYVGLEGDGFDVPGEMQQAMGARRPRERGCRAGHSIFVRDALRKVAYDLFS